jgi:hypothetical protein
MRERRDRACKQGYRIRDPQRNQYLCDEDTEDNRRNRADEKVECKSCCSREETGHSTTPSGGAKLVFP